MEIHIALVSDTKNLSSHFKSKFSANKKPRHTWTERAVSFTLIWVVQAECEPLLDSKLTFSEICQQILIPATENTARFIKQLHYTSATRTAEQLHLYHSMKNSVKPSHLTFSMLPKSGFHKTVLALAEEACFTSGCFWLS